MIHEMAKRSINEMRYIITNNGKQMSVGIQYERWVGENDEGDAVVEFRSREFGNFKCLHSSDLAYEKMLEAVRNRNGKDATEECEKVLQRF